MGKQVYVQVMLRTVSWKSDGGLGPFALELAHPSLPAPVEQPRGLLGWLFGRPKLTHQPAPLQIPWSPDADFVGDNSALSNNKLPALLGPVVRR